MALRVSIGVPVYNGERYLQAALDSILAQTFREFELIISDNASTDRTEEICRFYAARDSRITYIRNPVNLGAALNFNQVFRESSGEYFKWCAHDDLLDPDFLDACVAVLDDDEDVVLCHGESETIDEQGAVCSAGKKFDFDLRLNSPWPNVRFGEIIDQTRPSWVLIFGLIRRNALSKTRLLCKFHNSDRNVLSELSLVGKLRKVPEPRFYWRCHSGAYTDYVFSDASRQAAWWGSDKAVRIPHWRVFREYANSVRQVELGRVQRWLCFGQILKWLVHEGWFRMGRELYWYLRGTIGGWKRRPGAPAMEVVELSESMVEDLGLARLGDEISDVFESDVSPERPVVAAEAHETRKPVHKQ